MLIRADSRRLCICETCEIYGFTRGLNGQIEAHVIAPCCRRLIDDYRVRRCS